MGARPLLLIAGALCAIACGPALGDTPVLEIGDIVLVRTVPAKPDRPKSEQSAMRTACTAARTCPEVTVIVTCKAADDGVLSGCVIEKEEPRGYGSGPSVLATFEGAQIRPTTKSGQPVGGRTVRVRMWFPGSSSTPPAPIASP